MALSQYWVSMNRKDLAARAIVSKREQDACRVQKNEAVASYHRDLALRSSKYRDLEELAPSKISKVSEESRIKEQMKAAKIEKLEMRQRKLAHLLAVENEQYMNELTKRMDRERETDPWNITKLKEQINELERKRKEVQQNSQKRYMHHIWKCSSPCIKETEEYALEKDVAEAWEQRKEELEKAAFERQMQVRQDREALEQKKLEASQEVQNIDARMKDEELGWSASCVQNKTKLQDSENEKRKLLSEEQMLEQLLHKVDSWIESKIQMWDVYDREDQIVSLWHPQEKIKKMSREILKRLSNDLEMVNTIASLNELLEDVQIAVHLDLSQVPPIKDILESQMQVEKERLQNFQHLFHEEASRLWDTQFSEWKKETTKRNQLVRQLLESIKAEIRLKISLNVENQRKIFQMQKECVQQIGRDNEALSEVSNELTAKKQFLLDQAKALEQELQLLDQQNFSKKTEY